MFHYTHDIYIYMYSYIMIHVRLGWVSLIGWRVRGIIKPMCAMLNNVRTTVGGINSCTTHDACDGVVACCPFPPLFNVGNMTDVVEQCGTTSFLASPRARTSFNIGERGKGDSVGRARGQRSVDCKQWKWYRNKFPRRS